eukprot:768693-Hanusia_phi.AAC.11
MPNHVPSATAAATAVLIPPSRSFYTFHFLSSPLPFLHRITSDAQINMYVGESEKNIRDVFKRLTRTKTVGIEVSMTRTRSGQEKPFLVLSSLTSWTLSPRTGRQGAGATVADLEDQGEWRRLGGRDGSGSFPAAGGDGRNERGRRSESLRHGGDEPS